MNRPRVEGETSGRYQALDELKQTPSFALLHFPAMKRRDLLKALPAIAAVSPMNNKATASFFAVPADRKVIAFVNADAAIPLVDMLSKMKFPVEVTICPIRVPEGKTIDDVVRMYEIH